MLVTSRIPLHLDGEREFAVPPLGLPDPRRLPDLERLSQYEAVALFIERARAVRHDFVVTNENAPAAAEICVRLDGLPLAIELAAVRVKLLSPQAILSRLGQRLPLLIGGARDRPDRQRTLRGAIAWSHDLLDEPERTLFSQLAVFSGGATIEAVDTVCGADDGAGIDVFEGVTSLVDKSLLVRTESPGGELRVAMLETIREFAGERLRERPEADATRLKHALHFVAFAEEGEKHFMGEPLWLERCERDHDNLRAALRWAIERGEADIGLRIGAALWRFWHLRGHLGGGRRWLGELLGLPGARAHTPSRARAQIAAGGLAYWQSDFPVTRLMYEEAASIYRELGDRAGLMEALYSLAYIPSVESDFPQARALFRESLELARELGDRQGMAQAINALAYTEAMAGNHRDAIRQLEKSIGLAREIGNTFLVSEGLSGLGDAHRSLGAFERARELYRESLGMMRDAGNPTGIAMLLEQMSTLDSEAGRHETAIRLHGAAAAVKESVSGGAPAPLILGPDVRGRAAQALGREAAERAWQAGARCGRTRRSPWLWGRRRTRVRRLPRPHAGVRARSTRTDENVEAYPPSSDAVDPVGRAERWGRRLCGPGAAAQSRMRTSGTVARMVPSPTSTSAALPATAIGVPTMSAAPPRRGPFATRSPCVPKVYAPMTRPRMLSGTDSWIVELLTDCASTVAAPIATMSVSESR